jgi:two-component system, NarL family, sensor histidine kinase UhpB
MTRRLKILLLEDSVEDAEIVQRLLRKENAGYEFSLAMTQAAYLQALDEFQPDVILSDNSLPQFDAAEALKIIQQRRLFVPFILVTGSVSDEFAANIIKSGADDFILKDRLTRLPVAIEGALKQRRLEKEKQEAVEKLILSEKKYRTIFFKSPLPKWIYDFETLRFLEVNETAISHYGYSLEEFLSMTIKDIRPKEEEQRLLNDLAQAEYNPDTQKSDWTHLKKNGERITVETTAHFIEYNNRKARMVVVNDITERLKAEEALRALEQNILAQKVQEQKKVTRAVIKAQEKERNHIGRELHDNVNQILVSTKMYLSMAGSKTEDMKELIKYPLELIDSSIHEIRLLTSGYVTPLKDVDLRELIQLLLDKLKDNSTIQTSFVYHTSDRMIDDELKLNIYRIIQEQVNNIVKHAEAKNVHVAIEAGDNAITILVADDGKGFDPDKKRKGIGISNMINRVESFNGEMKTESSPGNGCYARIIVPY